MLKRWRLDGVRLCTVLGCDRFHLSRGLCDAHAARRKRGQALEPPIRLRCNSPPPPPPAAVPEEGWFFSSDGTRVCSVENCFRAHVARNLCNGHFMRCLKGRPIAATPLKVYRNRLTK